MKIFTRKKKNISKTRTFFEYSSKEKKNVLVRAAKEANRMQLELVREYERRMAKN